MSDDARPGLDRLNALIEECRADELLAELWLEKALRGDWRYFRLLVEYRNGPPPAAAASSDAMDECIRILNEFEAEQPTRNLTTGEPVDRP